MSANASVAQPTKARARQQAERGGRAEILVVANSEEFASLPPTQIVLTLADRGVYVASETSFYRVLKAASQQRHRVRRRSLANAW